MPSEIVYFVHISDSHIGPTAGYSRHGFRPLPAVQRLVDILNHLPQRPDFVVHTGDIVAEPDPAAYRLAARTFAQLEMPVYYVNGNHDRAAGIRRYLPMGPLTPAGDDPERLSYVFEVEGYQFWCWMAAGRTRSIPTATCPIRN
jgi:3',5'-cyclic-AMP phosphodiesterase